MTDNTHLHTVRQYMDEDHRWHWEVRDDRSNVVGRSHRGFTRRVDCSTNMHRIAQAMMPPIRWKQ